MYFFSKKSLKVVVTIIVIGYCLPGSVSSPIAKNAVIKIDPDSFWSYPWGESGVHKGIDIFCEKETSIVSPVSGFVISKAYGTIAGNYAYILGPKWKTYYFAHMDTCFVNKYDYVARGELLGKVGNTGNAAGKESHLHYAIETIFPYVWLYDGNAVQGWKKMFYLNPVKKLNF